MVLELRDKHVAVVGLGKSGAAAARLCLKRGARVTAVDAKSREDLGAVAGELEAQGARVLGGTNPAVACAGADLVVMSPGVPPFPELDEPGRRVIGEVELAVQCLPDPPPTIVAVGGTNGKSTTTALVGEMLRADDVVTFVGGNFGEPLADHVDEGFEAVVLEVSSFQMERLETFHPHVAILLNVTPDHLDRYPSFDAYAHAKGNMFLRQTRTDLAIVPHRDEICWHEARRGEGEVVTFGAGGDMDISPTKIVDRKAGFVYPRSEIALAGGHNAQNVAAAIAAARKLGVPASTLQKVLRTFKGLPHRTVFVAEIEGVRFYDDSKGTNVGASVTALRGMSEPRAVLIAGGRDKGGSYEPLVQALAERGHGAVLIGEAADAIARAIGNTVPVRRAGSMDDAVSAAFALAQKGDAVLLSPACSSFDMFRDYAHRGDEFVRAVRALEKELGAR